jgi:hypothetical protein
MSSENYRQRLAKSLAPRYEATSSFNRKLAWDAVCILTLLHFSIVIPVLMVGCAKSPQTNTLTASQAKSVAMRLANDEASKLYHCQPFQADRAPHFEAGRWVWTAHQGFGRSDVEARVELAVDGSTNSVAVQLLDSRTLEGGF